MHPHTETKPTMSYSKEYPSEKATHRQEFHAPEGPPPGYYEQHQHPTNPFVRTPSPAARGYPPNQGYNNSSYPGDAQQYDNRTSGQNPAVYQTPSHQYLSPQPTPAQPSPAPSGSSSSGGLLAGVAGTSLESLLNPPPPSFSRAPQRQFPYPPFPPCVAVSFGKGLDAGFPPLPPPTQVQPHPFMTHDVGEEDWLRFINDLKRIGQLSPMNKIVANVVPMALGVGLVGGIFLSRAFERRMKTKKTGPASELVEYWNSYFFRPRMMEVLLVHGSTVYNSSGNLPLEMAQQGYKRREDYGSDSSSSSSSSDSDDDHKKSRGDRRSDRRAQRDERRAEKRARREERRARKQERRGKRRAGRADKDEPWKLVVSYKPTMAM